MYTKNSKAALLLRALVQPDTLVVTPQGVARDSEEPRLSFSLHDLAEISGVSVTIIEQMIDEIPVIREDAFCVTRGLYRKSLRHTRRF